MSVYGFSKYILSIIYLSGVFWPWWKAHRLSHWSLHPQLRVKTYKIHTHNPLGGQPTHHHMPRYVPNHLKGVKVATIFSSTMFVGSDSGLRPNQVTFRQFYACLTISCLLCNMKQLTPIVLCLHHQSHDLEILHGIVLIWRGCCTNLKRVLY